MNLADLTESEKIALIGCARLLIRADGRLSADEARVLDRIVGELGRDHFNELANRTADMKQTAIGGYARDVVRREAQELIYHWLFQIAAQGLIVEAERHILEWLEDLWQLDSERDPYRG